MKFYAGICRWISRLIPASKYEVRQLNKNIMTLTEAIAQLTTSQNNLTTAVNLAVTALGNPGATPEQIAAISGVSATLDTATASLNTALTPPAPTV